jgi:hypothetical protein
MLELSDQADARAKIDDLIVFLAGDRCTKLRRRLDIAIKG